MIYPYLAVGANLLQSWVNFTITSYNLLPHTYYNLCKLAQLIIFGSKHYLGNHTFARKLHRRKVKHFLDVILVEVRSQNSHFSTLV